MSACIDIKAAAAKKFGDFLFPEDAVEIYKLYEEAKEREARDGTLVADYNPSVLPYDHISEFLGLTVGAWGNSGMCGKKLAIAYSSLHEWDAYMMNRDVPLLPIPHTFDAHCAEEARDLAALFLHLFFEKELHSGENGDYRIGGIYFNGCEAIIYAFHRDGYSPGELEYAENAVYWSAIKNNLDAYIAARFAATCVSV